MYPLISCLKLILVVCQGVCELLVGRVCRSVGGCVCDDVRMINIKEISHGWMSRWGGVG